MRTAIWALLVIALSLFVVWSSATPHGHAFWIMADPDTRWCCGPQDCFELRTVERTRAGWAFVSPVDGSAVVVPYNFKARYASNNEHYWACFMPGGSVRCFFTSPEGV